MLAIQPLLWAGQRRGGGILLMMMVLGLLLLLTTTTAPSAAAAATTADGSCSVSSKAAVAVSDDDHTPGVGSRVLHEDDQIKVWEMILQPGELAPLHTHEYPYTFIVETGSTVEVRGAAEEHLMTFTAEGGEVLSFDLIGDELVDPTGRYRLHKSHSARNIGETVFKEMLIEKKMR